MFKNRGINPKAGKRMKISGMTIKMRLTLLFTFLVAILFACFSSIIYLFVAYQRSEVFFAELKVNALATATIVLRSDNLNDSILEPYRKKVLSKLNLECINIYNMEQVSVFHQGEGTVELTKFEFEKTLRDGIYFFSQGQVQKLSFPFLDEDKKYVVLISAIDEQGHRTMARLQWGLLLGYVTSLGIVFAVGIWFASRATAPIAKITRQAESISATDLHIRVEVGKQRDELSDLAQAFNGMLDRLEKSFRSQKQFIANASHELRTPLTTMEGQLEVVLMKKRDENEYRQIIFSALEETRALRVTTNNLLLLTKAESEVFGREMQVHRIDEILFSALENARQRHPHRFVELEYSGIPEDERFLMVRGNEDLIRNALLNIFENAFKYSNSNSKVRVDMQTGSNWIVIEIKDQGVGIDPNDLQKIYEPFFRSERTHNVSGSGIGLTLVKAIVEKHGGKIEIHSEIENGTQVKITLPVLA